MLRVGLPSLHDIYRKQNGGVDYQTGVVSSYSICKQSRHLVLLFEKWQTWVGDYVEGMVKSSSRRPFTLCHASDDNLTERLSLHRSSLV